MGGWKAISPGSNYGPFFILRSLKDTCQGVGGGIPWQVGLQERPHSREEWGWGDSNRQEPVPGQGTWLLSLGCGHSGSARLSAGAAHEGRTGQVWVLGSEPSRCSLGLL